MMPRRLSGMLAAMAALSVCLGARADEPQIALADMQLMFCFQGKGSCLPYDAGVLEEAFARMPAFAQQRAIVAGNSSGSITAAYFGCHGFSEATVRQAVAGLLGGDREAVRNMENPYGKLAKMARGQRTEIAHDVLREYIAFALGVESWRDATSIDEIVRRSTARPRHPLLIVAANKEVLEDLHPQDSRAAGGLKEFDPATMMVSWRPEVFAYYQRRPEQFAKDHPRLQLGPDRTIGRAVTFFVDPSLYELLRRIPPDQRMADLRLMTDAQDVATAILASVSEPTYFDPIDDPRPEKILAGDRPGTLVASRRRTYCGGYLVAMPAQDVRRMLPGIRVLGAGWRHNPLMARQLLKNWLLADVEEVAQQTEWWADMEINPDEEFQSHMVFRDLSAQQEFDFGRKRARECFDLDRGLPRFVLPPARAEPHAGAIWPTTDAEAARADSLEPSGRLKTLRGLGPLLHLTGADSSP
jgi:hypothetical protein